MRKEEKWNTIGLFLKVQSYDPRQEVASQV